MMLVCIICVRVCACVRVGVGVNIGIDVSYGLKVYWYYGILVLLYVICADLLRPPLLPGVREKNTPREKETKRKVGSRST